MFARRVTIKLKPNSVPELTRRMEKDIIPLLRKQKGFKDEITFVTAGNDEALAISLWDQRENAEAYNTAHYTEVVKMLGDVVDGTPRVQTGEVTHSTLHAIAATPVAK